MRRRNQFYGNRTNQIGNTILICRCHHRDLCWLLSCRDHQGVKAYQNNENNIKLIIIITSSELHDTHWFLPLSQVEIFIESRRQFSLPNCVNWNWQCNWWNSIHKIFPSSCCRRVCFGISLARWNPHIPYLRTWS